MSDQKTVRVFKHYNLPNRQCGYCETILTRIENSMSYMKNNHYKTFVCRMDLKFPSTYASNGKNSELVRFLDEFCKAIKREVKSRSPKLKLNLKYLWKAESTGFDNLHYHLVFFCNATGYHSLSSFMITAQYYWNKQFGENPTINMGLVNSSGNDGINGTIINRTDVETFGKVFQWLSYLAKKETSYQSGKMFDSSQLIMQGN